MPQFSGKAQSVQFSRQLAFDLPPFELIATIIWLGEAYPHDIFSPLYLK